MLPDLNDLSSYFIGCLYQAIQIHLIITTIVEAADGPDINNEPKKGDDNCALESMSTQNSIHLSNCVNDACNNIVNLELSEGSSYSILNTNANENSNPEFTKVERISGVHELKF